MSSMKYGWRARIGLLIPSVNVCFESDLNYLLPEGITVHASRMKRSALLPPVESLKRMLESSIESAKLLVDCRADVILFGCTSASVLGGPGKDVELGDKIQISTGIPTIVTSTAVAQALKAIGVCSIAVFTPYVDEINSKESEFLAGYGFRVEAIEGLGLRTGADFADVSPEAIYRNAKRLGQLPGVEAVFLSCTNMRSTVILDALERDLGKPVVSSITASIWALFNALNIRELLQVGGYLLRNENPF